MGIGAPSYSFVRDTNDVSGDFWISQIALDVTRWCSPVQRTLDAFAENLSEKPLSALRSGLLRWPWDALMLPRDHITYG